MARMPISPALHGLIDYGFGIVNLGVPVGCVGHRSGDAQRLYRPPVRGEPCDSVRDPRSDRVVHRPGQRVSASGYDFSSFIAPSF